MIRDYVTAPDAGIDMTKIAGMGFGSIFGITLYVDSTHPRAAITDGSGTRSKPFRTIAAAVSALATRGTGRGDVILCSPLHTETVTAAGSINLTTSTRTVGSQTISYHNNVVIRGVGYLQQRPKIRFTTVVGASIVVASAGVTIEGFHIDTNDIDALTGPITVTGADFTFQRNWVNCGDNTNQPTRIIDVSATAARFTCIDNDFIGTATAGTTSAIVIAAANVPTIRRNRFNASFSTAVGAIEFTGAATRCEITDNTITNSTASSTRCMKGFAAITGIVARNMFAMTNAGAGAASAVDTPGAWHLFENYGSMGDANEYGIIVGGGAST